MLIKAEVIMPEIGDLEKLSLKTLSWELHRLLDVKGSHLTTSYCVSSAVMYILIVQLFFQTILRLSRQLMTLLSGMLRLRSLTLFPAHQFMISMVSRQ